MYTLIFLNGKIPKFPVVNKFLREKKYILAADGGANYLRRNQINPDLIIGDLDSISKGTYSFFQSRNIPIKKIEDQNKTDFEKCLIYCAQKGKATVRVFGATSDRTDHTFNNFSILKRYYKKLDIRIFTGEFEIYFIDKKTELDYKANEILSLLAIPKADKIFTTGLQYNLKSQSLEFGVKEGALNKSVADKVSINFKSGDILLFKKHFIR